MTRHAVVIPTYNERETLAALLPRVLAASPWRVFVVDDSSPDGTAEIVAAAAARDARVRLVSRPRRAGYGSAIREGMQQALAAGAETVSTLDADGSHDPALLVRLRQCRAATGADLVIGSRYIPGGGLGSDWAWHRRTLSRGGNLLARVALGAAAHDYTSGLRLYSRAILERVPPDSICSDCYSFLMEYAVRIRRGGGRIEEIPLVFVERRSGRSKMPPHQILLSLATLGRLLVSRER